MTHKTLASLTLALAVAAGACSKGTTSSSTATAPTPAGASATARPSNGLPASATPAVIAMGDSIYHARGCRNCHGPDAKGTPRAPDLTDPTLLQVNGSYADYVRIIRDGVPATEIKDKSHTNPMPARGGTRPAALTDDQINAVAAYVFTLRK